MKTWLGWIPAFLQMSLIFVISSIPGGNLTPPFPHADKLEHLMVYSILGGLIACRAGFLKMFHGQRPQAWTSGGIVAPLGGILYGLLDETHQLFVPGRDFSLGDLAADGLGLLLGLWLLRRWDKRRIRLQKNVS